MYVEIYGLGHIGTLSLLHLANSGFKVRGLDKDQQKVDAIAKAKLFQQERELQELAHAQRVRENILSTRPKQLDAITYIICVGTPSMQSGDVDLSQLRDCFSEIAKSHPKGAQAHYIIRSTIPPGTCEELQQKLAKAHGKNFDLIFFPEFIRTGQSWEDLNEPSLFIYARTENAPLEILKSFPRFNQARELIFSSCEYVKYVNNSWHALKVAFVNEIAAIGEAYGVNTQEVFEVFLSDTKLNLGAKYLRPGPPYGGPCLQKEVLATSYLAKKKNIDASIISKIDSSNNARIREFAALAERADLERIFLMGAGFRPGTEDERNSAPLKLLNILIERYPHASSEVVSNLPETLCEKDLIICGSIPLEEEQLNRAKVSGCQILDLGYGRIHYGNPA